MSIQDIRLSALMKPLSSRLPAMSIISCFTSGRRGGLARNETDKQHETRRTVYVKALGGGQRIRSSSVAERACVELTYPRRSCTSPSSRRRGCCREKRRPLCLSERGDNNKARLNIKAAISGSTGCSQSVPVPAVHIFYNWQRQTDAQAASRL